MNRFTLEAKISASRVRKAHALVNAAMRGWNAPDREGRTRLLTALIDRDGAVFVDIRHENGRAEQYRPDVFLGMV